MSVLLANTLKYSYISIYNISNKFIYKYNISIHKIPILCYNNYRSKIDHFKDNLQSIIPIARRLSSPFKLSLLFYFSYFLFILL